MQQARFGLFNKKGMRVGTATFFGKNHKAARSAGAGFMRRMRVRSIKARKGKGKARRRMSRKR